MKKNDSNERYQRTEMQRERIIQKLRENGCRITRQRRMLLDIILEEDCSCCKEIYYKALQADENIGSATVYRMVNTLEEIGAISRKNMYRVDCESTCTRGDCCRIELDDNHICELSGQKWLLVVHEGLKALGYIDNQNIKTITMHSEECRRKSKK